MFITVVFDFEEVMGSNYVRVASKRLYRALSEDKLFLIVVHFGMNGVIEDPLWSKFDFEFGYRVVIDDIEIFIKLMMLGYFQVLTNIAPF